MKRLLRLFGHGFSLVGLIVASLFSPHKYDWMEEVDPTIPAAAIEDVSGNRTVFLFTLFGLVIAVQLVLAIGATSRTQRYFSLTFVVLIVVVWIAKFAG